MSTATPGMGSVMSDSPNIHGEHGSADAFDALRDLFLGGDDEPQSRAVLPAAGRAGVEPVATAIAPEPVAAPVAPGPDEPLVDLLFLGHLPVLQFAWVTQYAREVSSQRRAPVALLRIRSDEVSLDLVSASGNPLPVIHCDSIEQAISAAALHARGLIVRVDATSEEMAAKMEGVDAITLLTGADEVALLAAYTTIKKLPFRPDDDAPLARLAIMGSPPERALEAAGKLERTAALHLQRDLRVSACVARIGPGRQALLFRGPSVDRLDDLIKTARTAFTSPRPAPRTTRPALTHPPAREAAPPPPPRAPAPAPRRDPGPMLPIPELPRLDPAPVSRLGHASTATEPAFVPQARDTVRPVDQLQPFPLHSHVKGLRSARIACPHEQRIETAIDDRGGLHLLAYAESAGSIGSSIASLLAVSTWSKAHASILSLAVQAHGLRLDEVIPASLHLLTPSVKECKGLAEAGLHIHLLASVEIAGRHGWFCTEVG